MVTMKQVQEKMKQKCIRQHKTLACRNANVNKQQKHKQHGSSVFREKVK